MSVGCIPITDALIQEVYILALEAKENGQEEIPVHVFPFRMTPEKTKEMKKKYPQNDLFWEPLSSIFLQFENNKKLPVIQVTESGYKCE